MNMRTVLAGASGGTANDGAMELAARIAQRFDAHIEGFHVKASPEELVMAAGAGFGMPLPGEWIDQVNEDANATAARTKATFLAAMARHGLPLVNTPAARTGRCAAWREESGYAADAIARRARFFDLVVLGRSERVVDRPSTDTIEQTLIQSGRPVLIAPAKPPVEFAHVIAVGWNGSASAVRVISAALSLLQAAKSVFLITVGEQHQHSAQAMCEGLAWHGIAAVARHVAAVHGAGAGGQLLSAARDEGADLLVMGGYGHTPWHELLLGGATREVVDVSLLPVLMAH